MPSNHTIDLSEWRKMIGIFEKNFNEAQSAYDAFSSASALVLFMQQKAEEIEKNILPVYKNAIIRELSGKK